MATLIATTFAFTRRLFIGRDELHEILDAHEEKREKRREEQHREGIGRFDRMETRLRPLEDLAGDVRRIKEDIGDHERGMRGQLHEHAQTLTRHELRIEALERGRDR